MSPKGVYPHTHIKPRVYPTEIVEAVVRMYVNDGLTVREVQNQLPKGFKAQRIIERHVPQRRAAAKRDQAGPKNDVWKGDAAGYAAAHLRVAALKGPASAHPCVDCGETARDWSYNGGCPKEKRSERNGCAYSPNPEMYAPRCGSCHATYDRRQRTPDGRFAPRGGDAHVC